MDRRQMNELMEKLGFFESWESYVTDIMADGTFFCIKSKACQYFLRSPLEAVLLERREDRTNRLLYEQTFTNLEHLLRVKFPEKVKTMKAEYDPLEGLDVPALGKKKLKKKQNLQQQAREIFKEVIRQVAAMPTVADRVLAA